MNLRVSSRALAAGLGLALLAGLAAPACRRGPEPREGDRVAATQYYCPMHPTYVSDEPGDCPICGMRLVPREPATGHEGHGAAPSGAAAPPVSDRIAVRLSPQKRQLLGVLTAVVSAAPLTRVIRTVGRVAVDERRLHHIHTKYEGYVEHLHVDFTGKFVKAGEPLLSIYSPELVATQQEYLLAFRAQKQLAASGIPSVAQGGVDLLEAARQRLLFWDIRPDDIARLERTGAVERTLDLHTEISGYVVQKTAFHGMRVTPADTLFDIADLRHLWVLADVYESDLPLVRVGMRGEVTVTYLPGRRWTGPVTYVDPTVEEKTRTVKVRIEVANEGEDLKPDMFADVLLKADLGSGLAVPESAVIHTGERKLVFVEPEEGRLEPREVQLGARTEGGFQVLSGLVEGERVVTSANFLIDSESSLKAAIASLAPAGHRH